MKLVVAGTGYVGLVAGVGFAEVGHDVTCVDVDEKKVKLMESGVSPIYEQGLEELMRKNNAAGRLHYTVDYKNAYKDADAIFIGVGTPEQPDGSANLSYIATVSRQIAESLEKDCLVVVKSTVPVGSNDKIYEPFGIPIVSVSRRSAEMIKYACNDFLALKISYMNDIANLCELVGADIEDVARGMSYDARIGANFLRAGIGYGGSCFPKDTKALKFLAEKAGYHLETVEAAVAVNARQKTRLFQKASDRMITFQGLKAAVLGLAFKPGTDDLREAPSLDNVELLLESGAEIYAYDPVAEDHFKKKYPEGAFKKGKIFYVEKPEDALKGANICFIFTEWKEIKAVPACKYKEWMQTPLVYDGRNIYDVKEMRESGVEYYSIGR